MEYVDEAISKLTAAEKTVRRMLQKWPSGPMHEEYRTILLTIRDAADQLRLERSRQEIRAVANEEAEQLRQLEEPGLSWSADSTSFARRLRSLASVRLDDRSAG